MPHEDACRLYLITPPKIELDVFVPVFEAALDGGDVACLQIRLKQAPDQDIVAAARRLKPICDAHAVALLINDRPDLAAAGDADGAHVGQQDMSYAEARRLLGEAAIIGVTCHDSRHLAIAAANDGADYVAFGAFFDTATKAAKSRTDWEILRWWSELVEVPVVAIGGITAENCAPLVAAGANYLAVMGGVWNHRGGAAAGVAAFNAVFAAHVASAQAT